MPQDEDTNKDLANGQCTPNDRHCEYIWGSSESSLRPSHHHGKYHCCITGFMEATISSNQL
ncbi:hypothetical protein BDR04DRAFT_1095979 [Suillus decipiens]|nr:hypothetical protein BDR04DRAFT_1095979 [Suillus decipiens]